MTVVTLTVLESDITGPGVSLVSQMCGVSSEREGPVVFTQMTARTEDAIRSLSVLQCEV